MGGGRHTARHRVLLYQQLAVRAAGRQHPDRRIDPFERLSLITLLGGTGLMFFIVGRWDLLGWHRADEERPGQRFRFRPPEEVRLAPAQRATAWYFLVIAGLFLLQGLLGAANAGFHRRAGRFLRSEPGRLAAVQPVSHVARSVGASFLSLQVTWRWGFSSHR